MEKYKKSECMSDVALNIRYINYLLQKPSGKAKFSYRRLMSWIIRPYDHKEN